MGYMDEYKFWLESDCFDEKTKEELRSIADDDKEIQDRFYKNLKFGTGGMRGIMGAGTNRMNIYTVTKATQGLADYILEVGADAAGRGVVIAHDCRNMSAEFTEASALCLNANGIKTYVFDALRPTPELSFAVRELGCIAGIVVTASHNPPEYNGYKVYWEDGSQIVSPQDQDILKHVANVERYEDVKTMDMKHVLEEELDIGLKIIHRHSGKLWYMNGEVILFRRPVTEKIIEQISSNPKITVRELSDALTINKSAVQKEIKELQNKEYIKREGGTRGRWHVLINCTT